jgi:NADPH:quinone reductase-like Zn-dependent oxidoreductase
MLELTLARNAAVLVYSVKSSEISARPVSPGPDAAAVIVVVGTVADREGDDVTPLTVIVLLLDKVPSFAVIVATPARTPVTTPKVDTFAIVVSLDVKVA